MANEKPTSKPPSIGFHSSERSDRSKDMPPGPNWVRIAGIWTDATAPTREPTTTPEERARMAELKRSHISFDRTIRAIAQNFSMLEKILSDHADRTIRLKDKNRVDEAARPVYGYLEFVATEYGGLKPGDPPEHFVTKTMKMITSPKVDVVFPSLAEWLERVGGEYQAWFEIGELKKAARKPGQAKRAKWKKEELFPRALILLKDHPGWTIVRIAKEIGCARSTLHGYAEFMSIRDLNRAELLEKYKNALSPTIEGQVRPFDNLEHSPSYIFPEDTRED